MRLTYITCKILIGTTSFCHLYRKRMSNHIVKFHFYGNTHGDCLLFLVEPAQHPHVIIRFLYWTFFVHFPLKSLLITWRISYYVSFHHFQYFDFVRYNVDLLFPIVVLTILKLLMSLVDVWSTSLFDYGLYLLF